MAKLTTALSAIEKGKFPSQTQPNPNNQSLKIVSKNNHKECKAVTILRSGKAIGVKDEKGILRPKRNPRKPKLKWMRVGHLKSRKLNSVQFPLLSYKP